MTPKFNIGDKVYKATFGRQETSIVCPDCLGSRHLLVILGDKTEVTIECGGCDPGGYRPSTGTIKQYEFGTIVEQYTITGVRITSNAIEYDLNNFGQGSYYTAKEDQVFTDKEAAMAWGEVEKIAHQAEENKRLLSKTRQEHTWKWNAAYHRKCIASAERDLAYHRSKVQICEANIKAKEPA